MLESPSNVTSDLARVRLGESLRLEWADIDFERNVIRINHPEKGSNPRILIMSKKLANMINTLPKKGQIVLSRNPQTCETALWSLRRKVAFKLQNPRLQSITFHTFRHWKATTGYHKNMTYSTFSGFSATKTSRTQPSTSHWKPACSKQKTMTFTLPLPKP